MEVDLEEIISVLWDWAMTLEDDPGEWVTLPPEQTMRLQHDLLQIATALKLMIEPTQES